MLLKAGPGVGVGDAEADGLADALGAEAGSAFAGNAANA
jgi:hypothetical protein